MFVFLSFVFFCCCWLALPRNFPTVNYHVCTMFGMGKAFSSFRSKDRIKKKENTKQIKERERERQAMPLTRTFVSHSVELSCSHSDTQ